METANTKYNWYMQLVLALVVVMLIYFLAYLMDPYNSCWVNYSSIDLKDLSIEMSLNLLLGLAIIETSTGIAYWLERRFPWAGQSLLRFLLQTVLIVVCVAIILYLQDLIFAGFYGDVKFTPQERLSLWQFFVVTILVSVLVSAVHTGYFLLERWKVSMSEAADLRIKALEFKEVAMQAELVSLKLQLDPHFMFNNFSTLSELINENPKTATLFLENLSRVYRYMIQNLKKDLVPIRDEIAFVKAYIYLIGIRHGEHVRVNMELDEQIMTKYIPPITIQLLIENAIKHNMATSFKPLTIRVYADERNRLVVTNNLQLIANVLPSTNMGLHNIRERYKILSCDLPEITETADAFSVALPIIDF